MKPNYKTLAPRQKELFNIALNDLAYRGHTTTEIVTRYALARDPTLRVSTPEGWDTKARSDARYVIQAMRNEGLVETTRLPGMKTAIYKQVRK